MRLRFVTLLGLFFASSCLAQSTWTGNGSGNWTDSTDWSGGVPNSVNSIANFNTSTTNTFVNVNASVTVGQLNIASGPYAYLLQGSSSVTLATSSGQAQLNNTAGNNVVLAPLSFGNNGTINISTGSSLSISDNFSAQGLALTKTGGGELAVPYVKSNSLTISQGEVQVLNSDTNAGVSVVHSLSVANGSTLDLTNNSLIVDYNSSSPISTLSSEIGAAYDDGKWDKPGITSSMASLTSGTTLGIGDAGTLGITTYEGQNVPSSVIVKYTWYGDANLDGVVNSSDLAFMQQQQAAGGTGWMAGDFNYDGRINADDYALFALGEARQTGTLGGSSSLPEPSLAAFAIAALLIPRRCARRPFAVY